MKKILDLILIALLAGCSLIGNAVDFVGEEIGYQLDRSMQSPRPIINDTSTKY